MKLLPDLVSCPSCEFFINFDFSSVKHLANASLKDSHSTESVDRDEYKDTPAERKARAEIVPYLQEPQLQRECHCAHVCNFKMVTKSGHTARYLCFCTRDAQAYDKVARAMWDGGFRFEHLFLDP